MTKLVFFFIIMCQSNIFRIYAYITEITSKKKKT